MKNVGKSLLKSAVLCVTAVAAALAAGCSRPDKCCGNSDSDAARQNAPQSPSVCATVKTDASADVPDSAYNLKTSDLILRDPAVFADSATKKYYIQANSKITKKNPARGEIESGKALYCYESKDLQNWRLVGKSFEAPADFWGKRDFWAPDMFKFGDKYYIIATFSCDRELEGKNYLKRSDPKAGKMKLRGCSVLVSGSPQGPYKPLVNKPITPENMMSLDGTLFEEDGKLYLLFSQEWIQVGDGAMCAVEVSRDLKKAIGKPFLLFKAGDAPWTNDARKPREIIVTDAPVAFRGDDGNLYMIWSSFRSDKAKDNYAMGLSRSDNGKLSGKWIHQSAPMNSDGGGHAMIFKTFCGKTKISYHAPNSFPERVVIKNFKIENGRAVLSD